MSTLATTVLATATAVIGAAAMYLPAHLRLLDARAYRAAADDTFSQAERLAAEVDRTRNLPWYWPTDGSMAIEAAPEPEPVDDPHVTGELLAIDGVDTETDAPHEDTDRAGMWRVLLGLASDLVDRVHDWLPDLLTQWRERNQLGSGQPSDDEPWVLYDEDELRAQGVSELELKMLRNGDASIPYDEATDAKDRWLEIEAYRAAQPEPVRIVRVNRYRDPGMTGQFPYVKVAGAPRHAAPEPEMPAINAAIPAQREAAE